MKTVKNYSEAIRSKYLTDKASGNVGGEIYKLTPANIRKLCINMLMEDLSSADKIIMTNFFEIKNFDNLRNKIKSYDIDGFRPICKFLKNKNRTIASHEALELIALLIDFTPRPYRNYKNDALTEKTEHNEDAMSIDSQSVNYVSHLDNGNSQKVVKTKNRQLFVWFSNTSMPNKLLYISIGLLLSLSIFFVSNHILNSRVKWMVWQESHYVEVKFDTEKYKINQLKIYKEERVNNFKKIKVSCETDFFNKDGSVKIWYGKNKDKALEYFTDFGLHPETSKTLKPITNYMIEKYICN